MQYCEKNGRFVAKVIWRKYETQGRIEPTKKGLYDLAAATCQYYATVTGVSGSSEC